MNNIANPNDIVPITIEEEMRKSYLDYAMSVIVSRALPDVRDGLKPVHRRILYAMKEGGYDSSKPYRKSARIVGDVMGKYHPHGDSPIYEAMVRMAQDFSMRLPLIDGQGNFGSMDGDNAAAMRYTEARLAKQAETLLEDIDKNTVLFQPNYDESVEEPVVLPSRFPNLLVNGTSGIAVGMSTNIPPHNLGELLDACVALLHNPDLSDDELIDIVPGPDFPTGAMIVGRAGAQSAIRTGRGSVIMRSKTHIETFKGDREAIIVDEVPYQVNKAKLLERMAEIVKDGVIEGISDLRDESDRKGVRMVIELKRGIIADVVLAQLFRHTALQTSFGVNLLALNKGRPELLSVPQVLRAFLEFREDVIIKRTYFLLNKARERAHILAGLLVAISNLNEVIALIRSSGDSQEARELLMKTPWQASEIRPFIELIEDNMQDNMQRDNIYHLSETQARAILDLRLQRLTGMERDKLGQESKEIAERIQELRDLLTHRNLRIDMMIEEFTAIKDSFATPRRTEIIDASADIDDESLIQREEMVVTFTHGGYIKRVPLDTYRAQKRGGKGRAGMSTKDDDFVNRVFVANTHTKLLFFSSLGRVYALKTYKLPIATPQSRGKAVINILPLEKEEFISTIMPFPDEENIDDYHIVFATTKGNVRRNKLSDFADIRANGKIAMKLDDDDQLVSVRICDETQDIFLATQLGMAIRFPVTRKDNSGNENGVRLFVGRNSTGVRGIKLANGDKIKAMFTLAGADGDDDSDKRKNYLQMSNAKKRLAQSDLNKDERADLESRLRLSDDEFDTMASREEYILTIADDGMGQLCSAYEYRVTSRGGKGIGNMDLAKNAKIVGTYRIDPGEDDIILVTDGGQIIRMPTDKIRVISRRSKGVRLFNINDDQKVVSASRVSDNSSDDDEDAETEENNAEA